MIGAHAGLVHSGGVVVLPPTLASSPVVSPAGAVAVGSVVSCSTGTWNNVPTSYTYQWFRARVNNPITSGFTIPGATASTYTAQTADEGYVLGCRVVASNAAGSSPIIGALSSSQITPTAIPTTPTIAFQGVPVYDGYLYLNITAGGVRRTGLTARLRRLSGAGAPTAYASCPAGMMTPPSTGTVEGVSVMMFELVGGWAGPDGEQWGVQIAATNSFGTTAWSNEVTFFSYSTPD
jgi:hypothetical protein